jgi:hypothetical protein
VRHLDHQRIVVDHHDERVAQPAQGKALGFCGQLAVHVSHRAQGSSRLSARE